MSMPQYTPSLSRRILPEAGRRLSRTSSVREERPPPSARWAPQVESALPPAPRRSGSGSSCGSLPPLPLPLPRRRALLPPVSYRARERLSVAGIDDTLERIRAERSAAGLGLGAGAGAGESYADRYRPSHIPALSRFPRRSASFTQDYDYGRRSFDTSARADTAQELRRGEATSPDRSVLGKFLRQDPHQSGSSAPEGKKTANSVATEIAASEGADAAAKKKTRKISRFLRPDFFDTPREESVYAKEKEAQKSAEAEAKKAKRLARRAALLEKKQAEMANKESKMETKTLDSPAVQTPDDASAPESNGKPESAKNRFLQSLEKKLEKLRSSGGDATVPSRVEQAINSLRKQSTTTDVPSESALLKRAVSVDDVRLPPSARPVSSVLGLLRRMEGSSGRRTQSVYAGATSDTVLLAECGSGEKLKTDKKGKVADAVVKPAADDILPAVSGGTRTKRDGKKQPTKDVRKENVIDQARPDGKGQIEVKPAPVDECNRKKESVDDRNTLVEERSGTKNTTSTSDKPTLKATEISKSSKKVPSSSVSGIPKHNDGTNARDVQTSSPSQSVSAHRQSAISNAPLQAKQDDIFKSKHENVKDKDALTRPDAETSTAEQKSFLVNRAADQRSQYNKTNETVRPVLRDDNYTCTNHATGIPAYAPRPSKVNSNAIAAGSLGTLESIKHQHEQGESIFNDVSANNNRRNIGKLALNLPKIELQGANHSSYLSPLSQDDYASTLSPADESESIDSWSVCSDLDSRDFSLSSYPKTPSPVLEDETVEERIRRKSFYTRFNDIRRKSHRKSSSGHLLGLKESVSRKSSFSDAPSLAVHPKKASRSQSLYNPSEIEAFADSKAAAYGPGSVAEGVSNVNAAAPPSHTDNEILQNGCGRKERNRPAAINGDRSLQFTDSAQDSAKACPEINGQKEDSVEFRTDNHRIPTVSRSKLPTLERMKKGEVASAKFKPNK